MIFEKKKHSQRPVRAYGMNTEANSHKIKDVLQPYHSLTEGTSVKLMMHRGTSVKLMMHRGNQTTDGGGGITV